MQSSGLKLVQIRLVVKDREKPFPSQQNASEDREGHKLPVRQGHGTASVQHTTFMPHSSPPLLLSSTDIPQNNSHTQEQQRQCSVRHTTTRNQQILSWRAKKAVPAQWNIEKTGKYTRNHPSHNDRTTLQIQMQMHHALLSQCMDGKVQCTNVIAPWIAFHNALHLFITHICFCHCEQESCCRGITLPITQDSIFVSVWECYMHYLCIFTSSFYAPWVSYSTCMEGQACQGMCGAHTVPHAQYVLRTCTECTPHIFSTHILPVMFQNSKVPTNLTMP